MRIAPNVLRKTIIILWGLLSVSACQDHHLSCASSVEHVEYVKENVQENKDAIMIYSYPDPAKIREIANKCRYKITGGIEIVEVVPKSSAELAGFRNGDIITHVNENAISGPEEYYSIASGFQIGQLYRYSVYRDCRNIDFILQY